MADVKFEISFLECMGFLEYRYGGYGTDVVHICIAIYKSLYVQLPCIEWTLF